MSGENAFGFLDPADIVRGCHIIPTFSTKKVIRMDGVYLFVPGMQVIGRVTISTGKLNSRT